MAYFIVFENITPTSESDPFFVGCLSGTTMFQLQKTSLEHSHGHHGLAVGPVGPVGPVGHRSTQMGRTSMRSFSFCFCSSKLLFASSSKASGRGPTEFQRILDVEQGWHGEKKTSNDYKEYVQAVRFSRKRIVMATLLMDVNGKKDCPKTWGPTPALWLPHWHPGEGNTQDIGPMQRSCVLRNQLHSLPNSEDIQMRHPCFA